MNVGDPGTGARRRILVVCYGNICRSPIAEALLRRDLEQAGQGREYSVRSAGVGALPGTPAARGALEVARSAGLDLSAHRARRLTPDMAREADVLVALDEIVEEEIAILVGGVPIVLWPVDDPYGGPPEGYRRALDAIDAHVRRFVDELRERQATRGPDC